MPENTSQRAPEINTSNGLHEGHNQLALEAPAGETMRSCVALLTGSDVSIKVFVSACKLRLGSDTSDTGGQKGERVGRVEEPELHAVSGAITPAPVSAAQNI